MWSLAVSLVSSLSSVVLLHRMTLACIDERGWRRCYFLLVCVVVLVALYACMREREGRHEGLGVGLILHGYIDRRLLDLGIDV